MEIITFNVGQGCFAVIRDANEAFIVDTHIPASGDRSAEFVRSALSKSVAGRNVRGLILTGFDRDHSDARGVAMVLNNYFPDWVMYPRYWKDTESASDVFEAMDRADARRRTRLERISVRIDDRSKRYFNNRASNMTFECFSPHPADMDSSNNCSLVVRVESPDLSYLITGDTENGRWQSINRIFGTDIRSDVMAAPHHGSRNGANDDTLRLVRPHTVIISAGPGNQFGHPHAEAIAVFRRHATEVYSTHQSRSLLTRKVYGRIVTTAGDIT